MAVGDIIKRLRLSHKLSQSELGKIAGVTDKVVQTRFVDTNHFLLAARGVHPDRLPFIDIKPVSSVSVF